MKFNLFKVAVIFLALSVSVLSFAQKDFQGKAYYQSKTSVDMSNFDRPGMSEDQKKRIADRMKSMFEKTYVLTFNQVESIYKEEEKLEAPGSGNSRFGGMMSSFIAGPQYKNIKDHLLLQDQEFFGKQFLIKDSLPQLNWKMEGETKQIGKYTCFKATATKMVESGDVMSRFRRPTNREENSKEKDSINAKSDEKQQDDLKEITIVAWYTLQIPINQGPAEYWGLPGLILEVNADKTTILCSKIVMNPEEKEAIKRPEKGKEVTKKEYNQIITEKMEEFRNSRGRGDGRPGGGRSR
tara:strand:+ start:5046 stop:5933 length:888 start_codon:yes stop_codon:yes gene_type:complete